VIRPAVLLLTVLLGVTACGGGAAPTPSPAPEGFRLRLTTVQAIPPLNQFGWLPAVAITGDGIVLTPPAVPAVYPGPLTTQLVGRRISGAGWDRILVLANDLGMLRDGNFARDGGMAGQALGRIELWSGDRYVTLTGDPAAQIMCITTPCDPPAGSDAAFGELWRRIVDLTSWLEPELGPEAMWTPSRYALLVGPAPAPEAGIAPSIADWPLDTALATFGAPIGPSGYRCGTVDGADADALRPALAGANQLTQWTQDPATSAAFGLQIRPLVPGEDVCRELFGLE
jgi:hypothetical protein